MAFNNFQGSLYFRVWKANEYEPQQPQLELQLQLETELEPEPDKIEVEPELELTWVLKWVIYLW